MAGEATARRPLVIGYGNTLRRDDGIGWQVADRLAEDPRARDIDVGAAHQLTPELAYDLSGASHVILIDAKVAEDHVPAPLADVAPALRPGRCEVVRLDTTRSAGGAASHHCTPQALATLAELLYGAVPPVTLVGVGVGSVDEGETLTEAVADRIPAILDLVIALANGDPPDEGRRHA